MRGFIFTLFLFSLLLAISEVKSEESRKLCGLNSRWRKHLESIPQGQQARRGNRFQLPNEQEISEESPVQNLPKTDSSGEESLQGEQLPTEGLRRSKKYSLMSRQDLQKLCCT
ncbi:hypothetical protein EI555_004196, partial [Monodon monoceros]